MSALLNFVNESTSFENLKELIKPLKLQMKEHGNMFMLSFDDNSDFSNKIVRQANGVIFEKNTNKVLHYSFEKSYDGIYTDEKPNEDYYDVKKLNDDSCNIELFFEGSIIKLFYYDEEWKLATSRRIVAAENHWSSKKSFKDLFEDGVMNSYSVPYDHFLDSCSKEYCYTFLLQHPENEMVTNVETPVVYELNRVKLDNSFVEERREKENLSVPVKYDNQNYMIYKQNTDGSVTRVKILSSRFLEIKNLRGNYPDIGLSYLQWYSEKFEKTKEEFCIIFNKYTDIFDEIDDLFSKAVSTIHIMYIMCKVEKTLPFDNIPEKYKRTINQLHGQYKHTQIAITRHDVINKISGLIPRIIANLIDYNPN